MAGILQTVDVEVNITGGNVDFPDVISVVDCEVQRVYAGGGSKAKVEVIFEELLSDEEKQGIRTSTPGATPNERFDSFDIEVPDTSFDTEDETGSRTGTSTLLPTAESLFEGEEMEITVDIALTNQEPNEVRELDNRVFTGTVTKVTENNDRIVTFEALDKRYQMNQYMVQLDVGDSGEKTTVIVDNILGRYRSDTGLQLSRVEDYVIEVNSEDAEEIVNKSWGVDQSETVYNVLQFCAYRDNATIYIDQNNVIHYTKYPYHQEYTSDTLPPILEWESGDKKTEEDIIVESKYDESGLGIFTPMASQPNREDPNLGPNIGKEIKDDNVFKRSTIQKERVYELIDRETMLDSGTIQLAGDPRIEAHDEIILDENTVDGFSAISQGKYIAKEVRHIVNNQDGYIVEMDLGDNPRELLEKFAKTAGNVEFKNYQQQMEERREELEEEQEDRNFFDIASDFTESLNPFV